MTKTNPSLDVQETLGAAESFFNKKKKQIIIGVAAVAIIFGGYFGYKYLIQAPRNEKAQTQLTVGIQMMEQAQQISMQNAQVQAMPDSSLTQALKAQGMLTTENPDSVAAFVKKFRADQQKMLTDTYNKALKGEGKFPGLIKIANDGGTDASNIVNYLVGICYYRMAQYKDAIKYLENFDAQGDKAVSPMGLAALANCYACEKQFDKAVSKFKKAADKADNETLSPLFLLEAGKILESQNKKEEANELYVQIKKEYPKFGMTQQGMNSSEIDMYIERTK